jgi:hypothetical protein
MIMMSSSEDDEIEVCPASKAVTPPTVAPGGTETRGMQRTREAAATAQPRTKAPTVRARPTVPEPSNTPPVVTTHANTEGRAVAWVTSPTAASTPNRLAPGQTRPE